MKENITWAEAEGGGYNDPRVPGMSRRTGCAAGKPTDQVPPHVSCQARAFPSATVQY